MKFKNFLQRFSRKKDQMVLPTMTLPYTQEVASYQKKFFLMLFIALIFITLYSYLYAKDLKEKHSLVPVAVATTDIQAPKVLQVTDIAEVWIPQSYVPDTIPTASSLVGMTLMDSVVKNEMILAHNIQRRTDPKSVASSDLFKKDFAININASYFLSDLPTLRPNDRVSIFASNPKGLSNTTKTVASGARVISVDKKNIVLNLRQEEIQAVSFAQSLGLPMQVIVYPNKTDEKTIDVVAKEEVSVPQEVIENPERENMSKDILRQDQDGTEEESINFSPNTVHLQLGDGGNNVRKIQERLVQEGFQMTPSGYFGDWTKVGVEWYQEKNGLPVTGKVTEATRKYMNITF